MEENGLQPETKYIETQYVQSNGTMEKITVATGWWLGGGSYDTPSYSTNEPVLR